MYAINHTPLLPLRANATEESELVSQIMYGEIVTIIEKIDRWAQIKNFADNEIGWVDYKMLTLIEKSQFDEYSKTMLTRVYYPLMECSNNENDEKFHLPGGSIVHNKWVFNAINNPLTFYPTEIYYEMYPPKKLNGDFILEKVKEYLNAPYLWGGKSILGIDCSGLAQVVYSIAGVQLPRNSSQQVKCGEEVYFIEDAHAGDLAFFGKEDGKISHVGILLNSSQIIHASGWVKIEKIDNHGIISSATGEYTHTLRTIKRVIDI
jgi:Cell wall-associated hydrolases (invasion-associated proteins)